jgi:enamine deaminase RidA (YjgF/YER057c/UK114 family)
MKTKLFSWLGREFVEIVSEAKAGVAPESAVNELFRQFDSELHSYDLSLDNAVRVRVWGRDRDARTLATAARSKVLTGKRRAASSSFISAQWFDSDARAGLELLAMRPLDGAAVRNTVDFEPARNYLCYLEYDRWLFLSGFTSEAGNLEKQTAEALATINNALARAQADWADVAKLSVLLQRGHEVEIVRGALAGIANVPEIEFSIVDGFAGEKYLLEIEATAVRQ